MRDRKRISSRELRDACRRLIDVLHQKAQDAEAPAVRCDVPMDLEKNDIVRVRARPEEPVFIDYRKLNLKELKEVAERGDIHRSCEYGHGKDLQLRFELWPWVELVGGSERTRTHRTARERHDLELRRDQPRADLGRRENGKGVREPKKQEREKIQTKPPVPTPTPTPTPAPEVQNQDKKDKKGAALGGMRWLPVATVAALGIGMAAL